MWGEFSKSIKAVLYDRISSPLLGTFAVSWVLWNHRFFTVLLSGMEPIAKFEVIDTVLYPTVDCLLWRMVAFPLLTTVIFIFLYPYPARFVFEFTRKQQKHLKEIRQRIEDETPLTIAEAKELRSAALQAQLHYEKDMQALAEENQQLREELQKIASQSEEKKKRTASRTQKSASKTDLIGDDLSEEAVKVLDFISSNEGISADALVRKVSKDATISTVKAQHLLDTLLSGRYVNHNQVHNQFSLLERGRALLVARGLA